ncbi:DUF3667 domain-containing protein [Flavobacterium terrisoli]|uniref:DUF3667 domain-containing protein n=1 Tax=Flavobacterium terrisoli TaxID=3242195 RepID=UPI0025435EF0|nr:DUF3667 domain-containing protein [Flavobacterium buctense]
MSKSSLRNDKTCLNCRYVVENRFCPNCGQENTDTRKTFHHLFVHFFEDLTHYENAFWKTIRNLYFKPASLTKEYLSGKRLSYLAPVRLYIFISFVTFFLLFLFPNDIGDSDDLIDLNQTQTIQVPDGHGGVKDSLISKTKIKMADLIKAREKEQREKKLTNAEQNKDFLYFGYDNQRELDSMQKYGPAAERLSDWEYDITKRTLAIKAKYTQREILTKFLEEAKRNFPKVLFIYMPLFALVLWLFHGKRRWYYFDHGIFTLHYFSFLLLSALLLFIFRKIMGCFVDNTFTSVISFVVNAAGYIWMFYYFFPAHHRFYGETRFISLLKSMAMFLINVILITFMLTAFMLYTFINIH